MNRLLNHTESRVVIAVLLMLLLAEGACRLLEQGLSADVRHLRQVPEIARKLAAAPPQSDKVLIVGNSLAREGIDLQLLESLLNAPGNRRPAVVAGFVPDGTSVTEWLWGYRRYFGGGSTTPDRVVIVTGRTHLDGGAVHPERLGAFHIAGGDLRAALASMEREERFRVLLARCSVMFANRDRLRPLVGYRLLPGYESATTKMVAVENRRALATAKDQAAPAKRRELRSLLQTLSEQGVDTAVITVPLPGAYALEESLVNLIETHGARFFDLSRTGDLRSEDFPDGYHLGRRGRDLLTRRLAAEVLSTTGNAPEGG